MRPETSVLLHLEPMSAVLARVAYRLIQMDYRRWNAAYNDPVHGVGDLAYRTMVNGFPALSTTLVAYAYHLRKGVSTASYKQRVVRRARWARLNREGGKPWARVPPR